MKGARALPEPAASATIGGTITNRVKIANKTKPRARNAVKRFRKDPSTRGKPYQQVCVSMPVAEVVALDRACDHAQMARSHFIRQAVKHFIEFTRPE
jgi:hypothetical protein